MKITVEGKDYNFDRKMFMASEAEQLKIYTGLRPKQFFEGLDDLDGLCWRFLVWLLRTRAGEKDLKFTEIDVNLFDIDADVDDEEDEAASRPTVESPAT